MTIVVSNNVTNVQVSDSAAARSDRLLAEQAAARATGVIPASGPLQRVTSISYLRAFTPDANKSALVTGYYNDGDGGGGIFHGVTGAAAGTYTDDGGTIIVPNGGNGSSAWLRVKDESIDMRWFGVVDDGSVTNGVITGTDNTAKFQAAINVALAQGGGTIKIPSGTFTFAGGSASLDPGVGGISFVGEDRETTILLWEGSTNGTYSNNVTDPTSKALFKNTTNVTKKNLSFEKLTFKGSWISGRMGGGQALWVYYYTGITIRDCQFTKCCHVCMDCHFNGQFTCVDSRFIDNARDCIRSRDTPNCWVAGNYILHNGDDAIALHMSDASISSRPIRSQMVVTGNNLINCGSIKCLGARRTVITGNTIRFPNVGAIHVTRGGASYAEGNVPLSDVIITDNIITDPIFVTSATPITSGSCIVIRSEVPRGSTATNNTIPGRYDTTGSTFIYPWDYQTINTTDTSNAVPTFAGVIVSNNILRRTAPTAAAFSDYGFGKVMFIGVDYDPAITDADLRQALGINMTGGGLLNASISSNIISHFATAISFAAPTSDYDYTNVMVRNNIISNCTSRGVLINSASFAADITIEGNRIDCDPYRQGSNSNIDGTYDADGVPEGINSGAVYGIKILRNAFSNVCRAFRSNDASKCQVIGNIIRCQPVATSLGFSTSNKGVGALVPPMDAYIYEIINSDPTSGNAGAFISTQVNSSPTMPSSGFYVLGAFVKNSSPTFGGGTTTVLGWQRVTTGSGHDLGEDWAVVKGSAS